MPAFYTLGEVKKRLRDVALAELDMTDVINEVCDRAYAIGRWPDSVAEVTIPASKKVQDLDVDSEYYQYWFCYVDADLYDGAIRFKVDGCGDYPVRPLVAEYADGAYWGGFVDMGVVDDNAERRYRMPNGVTDANRVTALLKKRWNNVYEDGDLIPIRPISAIKAGILAVNYENNNAINEAQAKWQEFEQLLMRDDKEFEGVKNLKMRFRMNTSSKATNFY